MIFHRKQSKSRSHSPTALSINCSIRCLCVKFSDSLTVGQFVRLFISFHSIYSFIYLFFFLSINSAFYYLSVLLYYLDISDSIAGCSFAWNHTGSLWIGRKSGWVDRLLSFLSTYLLGFSD